MARLPNGEREARAVEVRALAGFIVFYHHSVCLYPGEKKIGADKCNAMGNIGMVLHPIPGLEGVEMLPVA